MALLNEKQIAKMRAVLLREVDRRGPTRGLFGSAAGNLVREVDWSFNVRNYGCGTFRDFMKQYFPELRLIGKSGGNDIFGRVGWADLLTPQDAGSFGASVQPAETAASPLPLEDPPSLLPAMEVADVVARSRASGDPLVAGEV